MNAENVKYVINITLRDKNIYYIYCCCVKVLQKYYMLIQANKTTKNPGNATVI